MVYQPLLPAEIQLQILAKIKGLESVKMKRAGYAIEYDFVDPRELSATLETKTIKSLFLAESELMGQPDMKRQLLRVNRRNKCSS